MKKLYEYTGSPSGVAFIALALVASFFIGRITASDFQEFSQTPFERELAKVASDLRKQLPMKMDEITTLENVMNVGTTIVYTYSVSVNKEDLDIEYFKGEMQKNLSENICNLDSMTVLMNQGAIYHYMYKSLDDKVLGEFSFDKTDCGLE